MGITYNCHACYHTYTKETNGDDMGKLLRPLRLRLWTWGLELEFNFRIQTFEFRIWA